MKADYDSEADALDIELTPFDRFERQEPVDDDCCTVGFSKGSLVDIELLNPADHLDLLEVAAKQYDLDGPALVAAARAALTTPDRAVTIELGLPLAA